MPSEESPLLVVIEAMFRLMRTSGLHGEGHPARDAAATELVAALAPCPRPLCLQFVADAVFEDRRLVALDVERFEMARELGVALKNVGAQELTFQAEFATSSALMLGAGLSRGALGAAAAPFAGKPVGLSYREVEGAAGIASEDVPVDVAAIAQLALALTDAEGLPVEGPWPFSVGVAAVRHLERALATERQATLYAAEAAPGEWSVARRAVAASLHTMVTLEAASVGRGIRRAATHATLALALTGLADRGGADLKTTALALLPRLLDLPSSRSGVDPHRLRMISLVRDAAQHPRALAVTGLVELTYNIERRRRDEGLRFDLALLDLLAEAAPRAGMGPLGEWIPLLIGALGIAPPGAVVLLDDGRRAVVLGPGASGDPLRPEVMVDGRAEIPRRPVRLSARGGGR